MDCFKKLLETFEKSEKSSLQIKAKNHLLQYLDKKSLTIIQNII